MRAILTALILALAPVGALAEDTPLVALTTADETRGWEAVGRIDIAGSAFCTGTLIAPDLVLTAAHCLFDQDSGRRFAPEDFEFRAGWRNGRADAYRRVRRAFAHPDYIFEGRDRMDRVAYDLALLELDQPIRLPSIPPFATGDDPMQGDKVGIVSYALDRAEAPSLQKECAVLGREPGVLVLTCSVDFGSSGAPIFVIRDGVPRIVSVVSAKAEMGGEKVALGTQMSVPLTELMAAFAADGGGARKPSSSSPRLPQVTSDVAGGSVSGAKFVTP